MLVVTCLLDIFIPGHMFWAYRLSVWVAAAFGLFDGIKAACGLFEGSQVAAQVTQWIDNTIPMASLGLGWLIPSFLMLAIGLAIDIAQGRMKSQLDYDAVARERNQSLVSAGLALNEDELDEVAKTQDGQATTGVNKESRDVYKRQTRKKAPPTVSSKPVIKAPKEENLAINSKINTAIRANATSSH